MSTTDKNPKKRASAYQQARANKEQTQATDKRQPIRNEQEYHDLVGRRIDEAIRNGAFDNLRNKGKPLNLQRNPFVPEDMEMAYSLLEKNQLVPGWIADRSAIQRQIETFRSNLRKAVAHYLAQIQAAADAQQRGRLAQDWHAQLQAWEGEVVELNRRINTLNLQQPIARLELFKLRLNEELVRAGLK